MAFTNCTSCDEESSFPVYSSPKQRQCKKRFIPGRALQPKIHLARGLSQVQRFDKYTGNSGCAPLLHFYSQTNNKFGWERMWGNTLAKLSRGCQAAHVKDTSFSLSLLPRLRITKGCPSVQQKKKTWIQTNKKICLKYWAGLSSKRNCFIRVSHKCHFVSTMRGENNIQQWIIGLLESCCKQRCSTIVKCFGEKTKTAWIIYDSLGSWIRH